MALTGKTRVRMTRWARKLVLQVEIVIYPSGVLVCIMSDGSQQTRETDPVYSWRDATLEDLQATQLALPDLRKDEAVA